MASTKKEMELSILCKSTDDTPSEERFVYYIASEVMKADGSVEPDDDDHVIDEVDLEKGAGDFMMNPGRLAGVRHRDFAGIGEVFASMVLTKALQKALAKAWDIKIPDLPVAWIVGVRKIRDDVWESIKRGELDSMSMGGSAELEALVVSG